jgi:hypothetical protein
VVFVLTVPLENLEISERTGVIFSFIILADDHFSRDAPRKSVFDLPFARCPPAGESGSAPPNRRASAILEKTTEINSSGSLIMGLALPHLERLALGAGHCRARNGRGLASQGLSCFLELEGAVSWRVPLPANPTNRCPGRLLWWALFCRNKAAIYLLQNQHEVATCRCLIKMIPRGSFGLLLLGRCRRFNFAVSLEIGPNSLDSFCVEDFCRGLVWMIDRIQLKNHLPA